MGANHPTQGSSAPHANRRTDQIFPTGFLKNPQRRTVAGSSVKLQDPTGAVDYQCSEGVTVVLLECATDAGCYVKITSDSAATVSSTSYDFHIPAGGLFPVGIKEGQYIYAIREASTSTTLHLTEFAKTAGT